MGHFGSKALKMKNTTIALLISLLGNSPWDHRLANDRPEDSIEDEGKKEEDQDIFWCLMSGGC
jgi:hypothetical protein